MASAKAAVTAKPKVKSASSTGKFGFRAGKKKRQRSADKLDLEDSGVHLEESGISLSSLYVSQQAGSDPGVDLDQEYNQSQSSPRLNQSVIKGQKLQESRCVSAIGVSALSAIGVSALNLRPIQRITKSESPQPITVRHSTTSAAILQTQYPPLAGSGIPCSQSHSAAGTSNLRSSKLPSGGATSSQGPVSFSLGPDSDQESELTQSCTVPGSKASKNSKDIRLREKSSNKGRFKKILKPLRRSHSAGSAKDVPAHALFLRHDIEKERRTPPGRRSIDTGRGSMERQSDDSDSEQEQSSSSDSKSPPGTSGKSKKKSLAQDMKEKFSFLRRRQPDPLVPGKDGKLPKPSKDMVLNWSQSFDNLLKDKLGFEYFRDFLRTEFSEENVEFWIACEEYKSIKSNKLNGRAQEIFTDFVAVQAPREINLDSKTRLATKDLLEKPDRQTFEIAQKRIQALMDKDSYPRFLRSDLYQKLLSEYKIQLTIT